MLPMKRPFCLALVLLLLTCAAIPAAAQDVTPLDWIPADFTGYVRVDFSDPQTTLSNLNLALFVASVLQPPRAAFTQAQDFDAFIPLDSFDVENASFTSGILPWLDGEVVFAYRRLDAAYQAGAADSVMILPAVDALEAGAFLSGAIQAQDLAQQSTYRQVIIYQGDKTAFAFTPSAVLVGPEDLLRAVIDTLSGSSPALTADPLYQQVQAALPDKSTLSAYVSGDVASDALGVLVSGGSAADPILTAMHQSLADLSKTPGRLLLGGALDAVGVSVDYDEIRSTNVVASVALHTREAPDAVEAAFDPAVLELIPRSAMIVQSGADVQTAATDALHALPFLNFAGQALAAFPVAQPTDMPLSLPTAQQAQDALAGLLDALNPVVDVQSELLDKLSGSYALALLPRPNNVLPGLDAPFDLLLVAQTASPENAQAVGASASKLLETYLAPLESEQLDAQAFQTLRMPETGELLVSVGAVENLVLVGTGSAAQLALDAWRGDNRLIAQERWQNLSGDGAIPYVYVDVNAVYNTFLPTVGGPAVRPVSQLGVQSRYLGDNLFALELLVALSQ